MGFHDTFRMSVYAVICNSHGEVLQLKATYGDLGGGCRGDPSSRARPSTRHSLANAARSSEASRSSAR